MAILNLKNFPDALYEQLRSRAQRERRSVAQEVIHILEHAIEPAQAPTRSIMDLRGLGKAHWEGIDPVTWFPGATFELSGQLQPGPSPPARGSPAPPDPPPVG